MNIKGQIETRDGAQHYVLGSTDVELLATATETIELVKKLPAEKLTLIVTEHGLLAPSNMPEDRISITAFYFIQVAWHKAYGVTFDDVKEATMRRRMEQHEKEAARYQKELEAQAAKPKIPRAPKEPKLLKPKKSLPSSFRVAPGIEKPKGLFGIVYQAVQNTQTKAHDNNALIADVVNEAITLGFDTKQEKAGYIRFLARRMVRSGVLLAVGEQQELIFNAAL